MGRIVVLNGPPRSGKTTLAGAIATSVEGEWVELGVDATMAETPRHLLPGIGLRPGGERPDLEDHVVDSYRRLFDDVIGASTSSDVLVDVGIHDGHSRPLGLLVDVAGRLAGLDAWFVGVKCSLDEVLRRREATGYPARAPDGDVEPAVLRWGEEVHRHGVYDVEVDMSAVSPSEGAALVEAALRRPPVAFTLLDR